MAYPSFATISTSPTSDGLTWQVDNSIPNVSWFLGGLIVDGHFTPFIRAQFSEGRLEGVSLLGISSEHIATTSEESISLPENHIQIFT